MDLAETKIQIIAGEAENTIDRFTAKSEKLAAASEHAAKNVSKIGGHGGGVPAYLSKLDAPEREELMAAREEMLVRRARTRVARVEMQKEMLLHRVAETALLTVVDSQNKYAKSLAKFGSMGQMVGSQMYGMGGVTGKVGGILSKLGGYAAIAGIGLEALSFVDDMTGHHLEHLGEAAREGAAKLVGIQTAEVAARSMGFRNAEEMKAAKEIHERWEAEIKLKSVILAEAEKLGAAPTQRLGEAAEAYQKRLEEAAKQISTEKHIALSEAFKALEEAGKENTSTLLSNAEHQRDLDAAAERSLQAFGVHALSLHASADEHFAQAAVLKAAILEDESIAMEDKKATLELAIRKNEERDSIERQMLAAQEAAQEEGKVARAAEELAGSFKSLAYKSDTTESKLAFVREQLAKSSKLADLHLQPSMVPKVLEKAFSNLKLEKVHHSVSYPNARFDIRQNFAEGFSPDRIALAFSNDLARVSERKIQSNQVQPYNK